MSAGGPTYTDRELFEQLRLFEPRRAYLTVLLAGGALLTVALCWIIAAVSAFYLAISHLPRVVDIGVGAVILGLGGLAAEWLRRLRPSRRVLLRRLRIYRARPTRPDGAVWALLPNEAFPGVYAILADARLHIASRTRLPAAPADAPSLCIRAEITIADELRTLGDTGAGERARAAMAAAGIQGRVDGTDVPVGEIGPGPGTAAGRGG